MRESDPAVVRACSTRRTGAFKQVCALLLALLPGTAKAVILLGTDDPKANTAEPTGALTGSGWQYQGLWGSYLGTPIAERFFITARHIGGGIGGKFVFQGREFTTCDRFDDPNSDLRIWRICERFPIFAPLYEDAAELGRPLVVFGRGTQRGEPLTATDGLRGWKWGAGDSRLRWGENAVAGIADAGDLKLELPGQGQNNLLKATFDAKGGPNEAHLSVGDSGGAVFINDGNGIWKLAGINVAADGQYNMSTNGSGFFAALFDARGFYGGEDNDWTLIEDKGEPVPGAFYATRISSSLAWIKGVLASHKTDGPVLQFAVSVNGPFEDDPTATVLADLTSIVVPSPPAIRFYQLRGCAAYEILNLTVVGDTLVLGYHLE